MQAGKAAAASAGAAASGAAASVKKGAEAVAVGAKAAVQTAKDKAKEKLFMKVHHLQRSASWVNALGLQVRAVSTCTSLWSCQQGAAGKHEAAHAGPPDLVLCNSALIWVHCRVLE